MNRKTLWRKGQNIKVGDLVYHILYGTEWNGLVLKVEVENERCMVHLVPGMKHENYFRKKGNNSLCGWISSRWLAIYVDL